MKTCSKCNLSKEEDQYSKHFYKKTGAPRVILQSYCKECSTTYNRENKERLSKSRKLFRTNNPEALKLVYQRDKAIRIKYREKYLWTCARVRAKKYKRDFTISVEDIVIPEKCPLLGIPITRNSMDRHDQAAPTLDRVDNKKGYTKENTRVISLKANMMKHSATKEELLEFSKNIFNYLNTNEWQK